MYRYSLDRVGESEWVIFDREKKGTPKTYLLFLVPLSKGMFNYQLILTSYDAALAGHSPLPVFVTELYSTFFYSIEEGVHDFVQCVYTCLQSTDIDDPIELAYSLGGTVHSRFIHAPSILNSN